jgi:hypothetical protein
MFVQLAQPLNGRPMGARVPVRSCGRSEWLGRCSTRCLTCFRHQRYKADVTRWYSMTSVRAISRKQKSQRSTRHAWSNP